jgi:hypothetical protein
LFICNRKLRSASQQWMKEQAGVEVHIFQVEATTFGIRTEQFLQAGMLRLVELLITQSGEQSL